VLRCAVIAASFDGRARLTADNLGAAFVLLQHQQNLREWLKPNTGITNDGVLSSKIMNYLHRHAPNGQAVKVRDLRRATRANENFGPLLFDRMIGGLLRQRVLIPVSVGKADGVALAEQERAGYGSA
jgi:hypothetical protein